MSKLVTNTLRHTAASSDSITLVSDGTCTAEITNRSNRNLVINGAMQVAQRGTSSTSTGYASVDRIKLGTSGVDEALTQAQVSLTSSDTGPWEKGFRKAYQLTNGNQTSGADAGDVVEIEYKVESRDLACSGWDYTNSNSYVTLSFWVKASVAQVYYGQIRTNEGTSQTFAFSTGSLSANTWTKVTKTIPGRTGFQLDDGISDGISIKWAPFWGTNRTASGVTLDAWHTTDNSERLPDMTSTWYTTNDSTFALTGVQLELGSTDTDFEHRSYGDELMRCFRYFYMHADGSQSQWQNIGLLAAWTAGSEIAIVSYPTRMRTSPSLYKVVGTDYFRCSRNNGYQDSDDVGFDTSGGSMMGYLNFTDDIASSGGMAGTAQIANQSAARIGFDAEL